MSTYEPGRITRALTAVPEPEPELGPTATTEPATTGPGVSELMPATGRGDDAERVIGAETAPISLGEHTSAWASGLRRDWTPPDLWTQGRPPLRETWLWAVYGEHLPDHVQLGAGCRAATWALLPFRALFLFLDWIFERGSRVLAAAVLVFAVLQLIHPIL